MLTGLPARNAFMTSAQDLLARTAECNDRRMALLYLDLDGFKALNDRGGHDAGDLALSEVGRTLLTFARAEDVTGRLGGDEFALALSVPLDQVNTVSQDVAHRLIRAIEALPYEIGCSIGLAIATPSEDLTSLLSRADAAMYKAKSGGGNRVVAATS